MHSTIHQGKSLGVPLNQFMDGAATMIWP